MWQRIALILSLVLPGLATLAEGRTWTDSTGNYQVEASLVAFNDTTVVLKKTNRRLVAVPIDKLSKDDRGYLESKEAAEYLAQAAGKGQMWTMASGLKVIGHVVDYGKRDVTVQRRHGRIYVNDRPFDNLSEVYQRMLPKIVSHFENIDFADNREFKSWVEKLRGEPRTYTCEGVDLELENGDEFGIPFFFFSDQDQKLLRPGWERWLAADKNRAKKEQESFLLQSQAQAYHEDQTTNQQIALMQLQMQAYQAGMFDLWEVELFPGPQVASSPLMVVVPARDSRAAAAEAVRLNPGFVAGAVAKVRRKN
jgi:hypothetical protein